MLPYRIYDSLHGFIRFNEIERDLIDSVAFQRLHHLHQLGIAFLVYPGATHSRFEHSLGVMEIATKMLDRFGDQLDASLDLPYYRQIVRLAALCHDMGHLPFSHAAEKKLLGVDGHEKWTASLIQSDSLAPVFETLQKQFPRYSVLSDVMKLALGPKKMESLKLLEKPFTNWEKVFSEIITGDFFGADRIDYLLRDAQCTGVSHGLFDYHQLLESVCVVHEPGGNISLGIIESGIQSCEALLLARHFMHKRVYHYPSVKAYTFHLSRFMQHLYTSKPEFFNLDRYLLLTDASVMHEAILAFQNKNSYDAISLMERKKRFSAIATRDGCPKELLLELKIRLNIPDSALILEEEKGAGKTTQSCAFHALKKNGQIVPATELMEFTVPALSKNWLYVHPDYIGVLLPALEKLSIT